MDCNFVFFFFFKQKTAYEMSLRDWSSDVCSSDLNSWSRLHSRRWVNSHILPSIYLKSLDQVRHPHLLGSYDRIEILPRPTETENRVIVGRSEVQSPRSSPD